MTEDIQSLLEKINREGVEKAEAKAAEIIAAAERKAKEIVVFAKEEAAREKQEADKASSDYARRADETIKQAARDIVLSVKASVERILCSILTEKVDKSLSDVGVSAALVSRAVEGLVSGEVVCREELARSLASELSAKGDFKVILDEKLGTGFTVRVDGGRIEHSFTAEVISRELSRILRPDLAKLMSEV
jgi:V/A-type H+-transporting ATPase subunit E